MENKSIKISTDYADHAINMEFTDNLTDDRECCYILSAAFFSFAASQGLDKQEVIEMVNSNYDKFTSNDGSSLFKKL